MAIRAVEGWITSEDGKIAHQSVKADLRPRRPGKATEGGINIDLKKSGPPILGFGGMFNDAAIYHFARMSASARKAALAALFDPVHGAGWNLMRIPFGSTDWDRDWNFYTYDDLPAGQRDEKLSRFSIEEDVRRNHISVIKEAMALNPELVIYAAVWGPPAWMKDNGKLISDGTIPPKNYRIYARYLCKCVQAYEREGIPILSVSPQNEPLCNDGRKTPQALWMEWKPMRDFLLVLSDEFRRQGIKSQIWAHDHNFLYIKKYVRPLLKDAKARAAIDAVAWHDYEGDVAELGQLTKEFPDLPMYHTEKSLYSLEGFARILELLKNGCRCHNHWTTIQDEYGAPHQYQGGSEKRTEPIPDQHLPALVAPRRNPNKWRRTPAHEIFAQLTRFVKRGAETLSTTPGNAAPECAAFRNVDGTIVLVAVNTEKRAKKFTATLGEIEARFTLAARSAATYRFHGRP